MKLKQLREAIRSIIKEEINEAYVPDNIGKFAKERYIYPLVKTVASWAEKAGKGISGGTAIGKNYSTLILDLSYQDAAIYINTNDESVELYGELVDSAKSFAEVLKRHNEESQVDENQPSHAPSKPERETTTLPARPGTKEKPDEKRRKIGNPSVSPKPKALTEDEMLDKIVKRFKTKKTNA